MLVGNTDALCADVERLEVADERGVGHDQVGGSGPRGLAVAAIVVPRQTRVGSWPKGSKTRCRWLGGRRKLGATTRAWVISRQGGCCAKRLFHVEQCECEAEDSVGRQMFHVEHDGCRARFGPSTEMVQPKQEQKIDPGERVVFHHEAVFDSPGARPSSLNQSCFPTSVWPALVGPHPGWFPQSRPVSHNASPCARRDFSL